MIGLIDRTVDCVTGDAPLPGKEVEQIVQVLIDKLRAHSRLSSDDVAALRKLNYVLRSLEPNEDLIRQGDAPRVSAVVVSGIVGRYHLLQSGRRQYLSFHFEGDMPDSQGLFLDRMDHSVCAIGAASVALIGHQDLLRLFAVRPNVGAVVWRETLVDAAIFREAITNNSARSAKARMAHLFCELFCRAQALHLTHGDTLDLPIGLVQLGETLGMAIATVNRALAGLRATRMMDFRDGRLVVRDWQRLAALADFNPGYLHFRKPSDGAT
jgi:CRP-like cAMP-binding protein